MEKITIEIGGYGNNYSTHEILQKGKLEEIIGNLVHAEIGEKLLGLAKSYEGSSGTAFIYVDARTGEVEEGWLQQGNMFFPAEELLKIRVMQAKTGTGQFEVEDYWYFIDDDEYQGYVEWTNETGGSVEEYLGAEEFEKAQEEIDQNAWIEEFNWEDTASQLDDLYACEVV